MSLRDMFPVFPTRYPTPEICRLPLQGTDFVDALFLWHVAGGRWNTTSRSQNTAVWISLCLDSDCSWLRIGIGHTDLFWLFSPCSRTSFVQKYWANDQASNAALGRAFHIQIADHLVPCAFPQYNFVASKSIVQHFVVPLFSSNVLINSDLNLHHHVRYPCITLLLPIRSIDQHQCLDSCLVNLYSKSHSSQVTNICSCSTVSDLNSFLRLLIDSYLLD